MDNAILDPFFRLLTDLSSPPTVRAAEREAAATELWSALQESGFLDALVPEDSGGVGFTPEDISALLIACGEHLVPAPLAETMVARAIIAQGGLAAPEGRPILLWPQSSDGKLHSLVAPAYFTDACALVQSGRKLQLVELEAGESDGFHILPASIKAGSDPLFSFEAEGVDLMQWAAAITSAYMAGAMNTVLAMSADHANTRNQFGRPLAKFQAIQHHLAVMAERVAAANVGAKSGLVSASLRLNPWRVAVAKCQANEAATQVCALAHAIHGAIGISEEHDLQLFTRRIKRWQLCFGSEGYWAGELAKPWLEPREGTSIDIIRDLTSPEPAHEAT